VSTDREPAASLHDTVHYVSIVSTDICYNFRDIKFFLGVTFFGAPCTLRQDSEYRP